VRRRADQAVLITDAERSQEDQLRTRQTRYILMMSLRVLSLLVAAVVVTLQPPLLWLWLGVCGFGMIVVPWLAVVLANDRLPKDRHRLPRYREREVNRPAVEQPAAGRTIEVDLGEPHRDGSPRDR
jgi:hypothetical protein